MAATAIVVRVALLFVSGRQLGLPVRDLSLLFDGHQYLLIAHTAPYPYLGAYELFPLLPSVDFLSAWFPGYSLAVALVAILPIGLQLSALIVSISCGVVTVLLTRRIAAEFGGRPLTTACFVAVGPFGFLIGTSLALSESLLAASTAGMVLALLRRRRWLAVGMAAVAVMTQKAGVLVPGLGVLILLSQSRKVELWAWARLGLAYLPLLGLQLWFGWVYGNAFTNFEELQGMHGCRFCFDWPGLPLFEGFVSQDPGLVSRRGSTAATLAFYLVALLALRWNPPKGRIVLAAWIGIPLLFFASLASFWPYHSLWRFLALATPAAAGCLVGIQADRRVPVLLTLAGLVVFSGLSLWGAVGEIETAARIMDSFYPAGYFERFQDFVLEPPSR